MAVERVTTVLVAATAAAPPYNNGPQPGAYDLTDLETAKDELALSSSDQTKDAFIQRAITQASAAISSFCNRVFAVETIQDLLYIQQDPYPYQVPGGVDPLQLSRWPLAYAGAVAFTGNTHSSIVVDGIASTAGIVAGTLVFGAGIPAGTAVKTVNPTSLILTQAATATASGVALTTGVQVIQTLSVGDTQTLVYDTDFDIDPNRGWLIRLNAFTGVSETWEAEPVTVQYQAGYAQIPDDLVDACLRLVTARFRARGRDPMLLEQTQPNIGTSRYWVGASPGQIGVLPPEIEALVRPYRVPVAI